LCMDRIEPQCVEFFAASRSEHTMKMNVPTRYYALHFVRSRNPITRQGIS
jgi:hypothetical protein